MMSLAIVRLAIWLAPALQTAQEEAPAWRLRAEFEKQSGLLISASELAYENPKLFVTLVRETVDQGEIVALVNCAEDTAHARALLEKGMVSDRRVRFVDVPHDSKWTRDYGPLILEGPGGALAAVDAAYGQLDRTMDDLSPTAIARVFNIPVVHTSLVLQGGNFLANGRGIAITTKRTLDENAGTQLDERRLTVLLNRLFGQRRTLFLDPLVGETTRHVDMFAVFVSERIVVVGKYDPSVDPENAAVLDRNAEQLKKAGLDVVRIPMPDNRGNTWRTYTNIVFVNRMVLVPRYPGIDDKGGERAIRIYKGLLRDRKVIGVDANNLIEDGGALHCVTMNLGRFHKWPDRTLPRRTGCSLPLPLGEEGGSGFERSSQPRSETGTGQAEPVPAPDKGENR